MKKFFFITVFFSFLVGAQAVTAPEPFWYKLERGKTLYRAGQYGEALRLFEEARDDKARVYAEHRAAVLALLSLPEVRALQDNLDRVINFAAERYYSGAVTAFDELFFYVPRGDLDGKASASLDLFDGLAVYPEAEFWIGEVYRAEGASGIALKQYAKALSYSEKASEPYFETEILYNMAGLFKYSGNYNEMERHLLKITEKDALWSRDSSNFTKQAIQRTLENNGADKVLLMYRHNSGEAEKAHRLLGEYYYKSGRHQRAAEHYLFAWLTSSAVVIDAFKQGLIEPFEFTVMKDITQNLSRRPDIVSYMNEVDYYKTCYYLGASLYGAGKDKAARSLFSFLADETEAGEWRVRAQKQLRSPFLEQAVTLN